MRTTELPSPRRRAWPGLLMACCALAGLLAGCTIEDPEAPSFTTRMIVPLGVHDVTMDDVLSGQDFLYAGMDSTIFFTVEGDTTDLDLELDLNADLDGSNVDVELGSFELEAVDPIGFNYRLDELAPGVNWGLLPIGAPVPAYDFSLAGTSQDIPDIDSAVIESGSLTMSITNGLPFPVSGDNPPEALRAEIYDNASNLVLSVPISGGQIASGETRTETVDLAGVTLPGTIAVTLVGGWSATTTTQSVDGSESIAVSVSMDDLVVASASAVVGAQSFDETASTPLPDDPRIISAEIESGEMVIDFVNELPLTLEFTMTFDEIRDSGGAPLSETLAVPALGTARWTIDMAGALIQDDGVTPMTELGYGIQVSTPGSGGTPVAIIPGMGLEAEILPATLRIREITGEFEEQVFDLDPIEQDIDLPAEMDGLTLAEAEIDLEIDNSSGVSGVIEISMGGEDEFGFPVPTVINRTIDLAANGTTTTSLDVADLLSDLPAVFTFEGRVIVGGAGRVGTIESDASAEVRWTIDAPLKLSLTSESTVESDPVELEMDDSEREDLRDYLVEGTFIMDIENHFPFGMDVHFQVGADSLGALDITNPNTHLLATVSMDPGQLDGNGFVSASTTRRDTVLIGETEIGWIADGGWTAVVTTIPSTGTAVGLHMRDYLAVTGIAQVEVLVEEDDDE